MKRAFIILNGNLSRNITADKPQKNDLVICADGGAVLAKKNGITPDIIIGDFDSIPGNVKAFYEKKKVIFIEYPREKDYTDAELAIEYALKHNAQELIIFGLFGDRIDHMISNIFHLATIAKKVSCRFIEGTSELLFIDSHTTVTGNKGDELSLIPLKSDAEGVTAKGVYYPLQNEKLSFGTTRGISNIFTGNSAEITVQKGLLLAIHSRKSAA